MSAKAARRLLFFAFAVSLLVHLAFVFSVRPPLPNDEVVLTLIKSVKHSMRIVDETPQSSPPPSPAPKPRSPAQHPRANAKPIAMHLPVAVAHTEGPVVAATSGTAVVVTETPGAPASTPRPCNAPAAISAPPNPPEIAPEVRAQMTSGTAQVLVHLDAMGNVLETNVTASTGNPSLDQIAISMARSATYLAPRAQCKAIAGDYTFSARFAPW